MQKKKPKKPPMPSNHLLPDISSVKMKVHVHTITCLKMFMAAFLVIANNWKQAKCPSTGGQQNLTYPYKKYY